MSNISVGDTILRGYSFAARKMLNNLGLTWLAAVFYAVAVGYWLQAFCTTMLVSPHPGSELNDFALFDLFGLVVTTAFGSAIIARTLTGAALEPGGETMTAYFAVAKREWILFLSSLRLYAFVIVALFAVILLGGLAITMALPMIGANAQWNGITALSAMNAAVAVIAFAVTATLVVRLGFFAAPVASAESSMSMTRVWSLSSDNSWRLFAVAFALSAPVLLLWAAAGWALLGSDLNGAVTTALSPSHDSTAFYQVVQANIAAIAVAWTVLLVILNMLHAGASAPAYLTVRDNVVTRPSRSAPDMMVMEPAFAGSFAGFGPRYAKGPVADDVASFTHAEPAPQTFTAAPETETPVETVPETAALPEPEVAAEPDAADVHVAEAPAPEAAAVLETPIVAAAIPEAEEAVQRPETVQEPHASAAHPDEAHEPLILADEVHEALAPATQDETPPMTVAQFPLGADTALEIAPEHVETAPAESAPVESHDVASEIIPLPSHGDETESSQQNAPSEAA